MKPTRPYLGSRPSTDLATDHYLAGPKISMNTGSGAMVGPACAGRQCGNRGAHCAGFFHCGVRSGVRHSKGRRRLRLRSDTYQKEPLSPNADVLARPHVVRRHGAVPARLRARSVPLRRRRFPPKRSSLIHRRSPRQIDSRPRHLERGSAIREGCERRTKA